MTDIAIHDPETFAAIVKEARLSETCYFMIKPVAILIK